MLCARRSLLGSSCRASARLAPQQRQRSRSVHTRVTLEKVSPLAARREPRAPAVAAVPGSGPANQTATRPRLKRRVHDHERVHSPKRKCSGFGAPAVVIEEPALCVMMRTWLGHIPAHEGVNRPQLRMQLDRERRIAHTCATRRASSSAIRSAPARSARNVDTTPQGHHTTETSACSSFTLRASSCAWREVLFDFGCEPLVAMNSAAAPYGGTCG